MVVLAPESLSCHYQLSLRRTRRRIILSEVQIFVQTDFAESRQEIDKPLLQRITFGMQQPPDPSTLPCSPLTETCGLKYFPRMLGKIRLHAEGKLWADLHANLGSGSDGALVNFLHLNYQDLKKRVLQGGTDEEIFRWCEEQTRPLNETDKLIWNAYTTKLGWNDHISAILAKRKADAGLAHRDDIQTIAHYIDVDEGRLQ